jgi:hypothetical protein
MTVGFQRVNKSGEASHPSSGKQHDSDRGGLNLNLESSPTRFFSRIREAIMSIGPAFRIFDFTYIIIYIAKTIIDVR